MVPIIESVLERHRGIVKDDFDTYRNHVYRVYRFCLKMDPTNGSNDKYAIAAVFHDLGIWTHQTFDYLRPSIDDASAYLEEIQKPEWKPEISTMIDMHHKIRGYSGAFQNTVETFRRADWMDVTKGFFRSGLSASEVAGIQQQYPFLGFHRFLLKQTSKHFVRHPLNPLPMFRL